jgi:hypothetical protein
VRDLELSTFLTRRKHSASSVGKQFGTRHFECNGNGFDVVNRNVSLAPFNRSDVRAMKPSKFRQPFLAEIPVPASSTDVLGEHKSSWPGPPHQRLISRYDDFTSTAFK